MNKLFYCCKQKTFDCKAGNVNESAYVSISAIALYVGVYVCICEYAEYVSGFFWVYVSVLDGVYTEGNENILQNIITNILSEYSERIFVYHSGMYIIGYCWNCYT